MACVFIDCEYYEKRENGDYCSDANAPALNIAWCGIWAEFQNFKERRLAGDGIKD